MMSINRIIFVLLLMYISIKWHVNGSSEIKNFIKEKHLPVNSNKFFVPGTYENRQSRAIDKFHYAVCEIDKKDIPCNVTVESTTDTKTCNVRISPLDKSRKLYNDHDHVELWAFSESKIMVHWLEKGLDDIQNDTYDHIGLSIVDMKNCKRVNLGFPVNMTSSYFYDKPVLIYRDNFVILSDNNGTLCETTIGNGNDVAPICRSTYDADGNLIKKPTYVWPDSNVTGYVMPISEDMSETNFFVTGIDEDINETTIWYLQPNGDTLELTKIGIEDEKPPKYYLGMSNFNKRYGLCMKIGDDTTKANCLQLDSNGHVTLNVTIKLEDKNWIDVFNLADGGILLITGKCSNETQEDILKCQNFDILKVETDGTHGKLLKVDEIKHECYNALDEFWIDNAEDGDKICFFFSCKSTDWDFQYIAKCLPKSLLLTKNKLNIR